MGLNMLTFKVVTTDVVGSLIDIAGLSDKSFPSKTDYMWCALLLLNFL